jgi:uncharacterized membrane protein YccF (DUF307 family)
LARVADNGGGTGEKETTMALLRFLGNVIWLLIAGLPLALGYALAGVVACLLIVTIPFGIASFRLALYALWPFGRTIVDKPGAGAPSVLGNVLWFLIAGWWLALSHLLLGIAFIVTILGIPFGVASLKMAYLAVFPLGKEIVPAAALEHMYRWPQVRRAA